MIRIWTVGVFGLLLPALRNGTVEIFRPVEFKEKEKKNLHYFKICMDSGQGSQPVGQYGCFSWQEEWTSMLRWLCWESRAQYRLAIMNTRFGLHLGTMSKASMNGHV